MTHFKSTDELERDIRNQVLFDSMRRLNRRQKLMILAKRFNYPLALGALFCAIFWIVLCMTVVHADELHVPCPTTEPCKIVVLSQGEEKLLMQPNGILDTAAQARALDLGQFAVYLKTRIANSPAGEPVKPTAPVPPNTAVEGTPTVGDKPN
jgi:hypothetical protein